MNMKTKLGYSWLLTHGYEYENKDHPPNKMKSSFLDYDYFEFSFVAKKPMLGRSSQEGIARVIFKHYHARISVSHNI